MKVLCEKETIDAGAALLAHRAPYGQKESRTPEGFVRVCAKTADAFNFVSRVSVTVDPERGEVRAYSCECGDFLAHKRFCAHCAALLLMQLRPGEEIETADGSAPCAVAVAASEEADQTPASAEALPDAPEAEYPEPSEDGVPEEAPQAAPVIIEEEAAAVVVQETTEAAEEDTEPVPAPQTPPEAETAAGPAPDENTEEAPPAAAQDFLPPGIEVLFGATREEALPVVWTPNDTERLFHTNTGIIGTMGTGKTQFTKSLIAQTVRNGEKNLGGDPPNILIFDYKGDYNETKADFTAAARARVLRPYRLPYNPFALTRGVTFRPLLPMHTANAFKDTVSKIFPLGPKQQQLLLDCIVEAYARCGIRAEEERTWDRLAPTFSQVWEVFAEKTENKPADSLTAAMSKLQQFRIFEDRAVSLTSIGTALKGTVVLDLSGYDPDIQNLVVAITLDQYYAHMQTMGSSQTDGRHRQLRQLILVDEADNFMRENFPSLRKIMKEGREFGVGTVLSTQSLTHFAEGADDYSRYILTWVVHAVSDLKQRDVEYIFKLPPKSPLTEHLYAEVKGLPKHYSVVKIASDAPVVMKDLAFWQLMQENG